MNELDEAFMTFDIARKEFDFNFVKRKSTGLGLGGQSMFVEDAKYQTGDFNKAH
jgi:hypothetical protein